MFDAHLYKKIAELEKQNQGLAAQVQNEVATRKDRERELDQYRNNLDEEKRTLKFELMHAKELANIDKEKALQELTRKMQESLVTSDISREQALAKLSVYEKMDTKADANTIKDMVSKLIDAIGKTNVNLLKSN